MIDKCQHCTLRDSDKLCFAQTDNAAFQCEYIDPNNPKYHPAHVEKHKVYNGLKEKAPPRLPSVIKMAGNFAKSLTTHILHGLKHTLPEVQQERLTTCESCEFYLAETHPRCSHPECGCFLEIKTGWANEKCPLGKWGTVAPNELKDKPPQPEPCVPCGQK